jgi:hypothetical protein
MEKNRRQKTCGADVPQGCPLHWDHDLTRNATAAAAGCDHSRQSCVVRIRGKQVFVFVGKRAKLEAGLRVSKLVSMLEAGQD